jgi:hypothetical protein
LKPPGQQHIELLIYITVCEIKQNKDFWEELNAYFQFNTTWVAQKTMSYQAFFVSTFAAAGMCIPSECLATIGGYTDISTDSPLL